MRPCPSISQPLEEAPNFWSQPHEVRDELSSAAAQMLAGDSHQVLEGLRRLRAITVDRHPSILADFLDERSLVLYYFTRKIVGDLWFNFAMDSTFDFDQTIDYMYAVGVPLARLISSISSHGDEFGEDPWALLSEVLLAYVAAVEAANSGLLQPRTYDLGVGS